MAYDLIESFFLNFLLLSVMNMLKLLTNYGAQIGDWRYRNISSVAIETDCYGRQSGQRRIRVAVETSNHFNALAAIKHAGLKELSAIKNE